MKHRHSIATAFTIAWMFCVWVSLLVGFALLAQILAGCAHEPAVMDLTAPAGADAAQPNGITHPIYVTDDGKVTDFTR